MEKENKKHASYGMIASVACIALIALIAFFAVKHRSGKQQDAKMTNSKASPAMAVAPGLSSDAYDGKFAGFKINPPKGWNQGNVEGAAHIVFYNPKADQESGTDFRANISVATQVANGVRLDQLLTSSKKSMKDTLANYREVQDRSITVDGQPARIIEATYLGSNLPLHIVQLVTVKNNNEYVVTGTALDSSWSKYQKLFNDTQMSLKLTEVR
jgi:hypothetical protein